MIKRHPTFVSPVAMLTDKWADAIKLLRTAYYCAWNLATQPIYLYVAKPGTEFWDRTPLYCVYVAEQDTCKDIKIYRVIRRWITFFPRDEVRHEIPADDLLHIQWWQIPLLGTSESPVEPSP